MGKNAETFDANGNGNPPAYVCHDTIRCEGCRFIRRRCQVKDRAQPTKSRIQYDFPVDEQSSVTVFTNEPEACPWYVRTLGMWMSQDADS